MKEIRDIAKDLKILYVEDDEDTLCSIADLFYTIFGSVNTASDGVKALEKYKQYHKDSGSFYDIVITDLTMPNMDGLTLTKEILDLNKDQVIIIVSANDNFEQIIELINLGINYFVRKPIELKNLNDVLIKSSKYIENEKKLIQKAKEIKELNETLEEKVDQQTLSLYQRLYYDHLTKLPKRNKLTEDIKNLKPYGILIVNINDFKDINNVYGDDVGDKVLIEFSKILFKIALERDCSLYSIGADEFAFLNYSNDTDSYCKETASFIVKTIFEKGVNVLIDNENVNISLHVTVGMTVTKEHMLNNAQVALKYATKKKIPFFMYDKLLDLEKDSSTKLKNVKLIKKAIKEDLFIPFFQPIFTNKGKIKYETLIRIIDNDKVYSPFFFLDTAKKIRLYDEITKVVIRKSFEIFENRDEEFSINLSFEDIVNSDMVDYLFEMVNKYKVKDKLIIEILESENIDDFNIVQEFIKKLKSFNIKIAIDDFGSGYSNFIYLAKIKPDFIKIDGSIIKEISNDLNSYEITKNIHEFAKKLGAKTVGEFIYNEDVYNCAKEIGIDAFQGFFLGEPKSKLIDLV